MAGTSWCTGKLRVLVSFVKMLGTQSSQGSMSLYVEAQSYVTSFCVRCCNKGQPLPARSLLVEQSRVDPRKLQAQTWSYAHKMQNTKPDHPNLHALFQACILAPAGCPQPPLTGCQSITIGSSYKHFFVSGRIGCLHMHAFCQYNSIIGTSALFVCHC